MAAAIGSERVLAVHHWTDTQFTFTTTRDSGSALRQRSVRHGRAAARGPAAAARLQHRERQLRGAPRLPQHQGAGRAAHLAACSTCARATSCWSAASPPARWCCDDLTPGRRLYLLCTGTGAAPFLSLISDPEVYERFALVVLVHGVRWARESDVVRERIERLRGHELLGAAGARAAALLPDRHPRALRAPRPAHRPSSSPAGCARDLALPPLDPATDRVMVCGSPAMLTDTAATSRYARLSRSQRAAATPATTSSSAPSSPVDRRDRHVG